MPPKILNGFESIGMQFGNQDRLFRDRGRKTLALRISEPYSAPPWVWINTGFFPSRERITFVRLPNRYPSLRLTVRMKLPQQRFLAGMSREGQIHQARKQLLVTDPRSFPHFRIHAMEVKPGIVFTSLKKNSPLFLSRKNRRSPCLRIRAAGRSLCAGARSSCATCSEEILAGMLNAAPFSSRYFDS